MLPSNIHATAIVAPGANISKEASIGPFCVVGKDVVLEKNVSLASHVCIDGDTVIGEGTKIFPFACIGYIPQDLKYDNEPSKVLIGKNNIIREYVTIHSGTKHGNMQTVIGNDCLLMVGAHVAHDCIIGNNVILANSATLGGHVIVEDYAILGGLSAVHQFVRIGAHAMVGGFSGVGENVIPYGKVAGERAVLRGINVVGMKRRNFPQEEILSLRKAIAKLFSDDNGNLATRINETKQEYQNTKTVMDIVNFLEQDSTRTMCKIDKNFMNS